LKVKLDLSGLNGKMNENGQLVIVLHLYISLVQSSHGSLVEIVPLVKNKWNLIPKCCHFNVMCCSEKGYMNCCLLSMLIGKTAFYHITSQNASCSSNS
jgi:hypothetical protein